MEAMSLDEYLGLKGLSMPISDFMDDKLKLRRSTTQRERNTLERQATIAAETYRLARQSAIKEYNNLLLSGQISAPTKLATLMRQAQGHSDNSATQAARRLLRKRFGIIYAPI